MNGEHTIGSTPLPQPLSPIEAERVASDLAGKEAELAQLRRLLGVAEASNKAFADREWVDERLIKTLRTENELLRQSVANVAAALPPIRVQMAATILNGILACPRDYKGAETQESRVALAIEYADELLKQTGKGAGA